MIYSEFSHEQYGDFPMKNMVIWPIVVCMFTRGYWHDKDMADFA